MSDHVAAIAVVGMAGRFPGARSVDELWRNLRDGVESVRHFSDEELREAGVDPAVLAQPGYVKAKGALDDADLFDAAFFGLNPREAEVMDPQHRLFLECSWEALENAGYDPERYAGRIGVFAGAGMNTYLLMNLYPARGLVQSAGLYQAMLGNEKDFVSTRVSYKLGLRGPSLTVQSACSTSLVAVHLACQSLLAGECDMALAGGVSIGSPLRSGYLFVEGGILSPDGHCRAFDARARGTVVGNAVAGVVLKRLGDALADGDTIRAVIRGSAVNNDGALKVGYTAPSVDGQAQVIAEALAMADVRPADVSYVEAHGTGTPLGDPIEVAALRQVFGTRPADARRCVLGAVKTNLGHLDVAAGVTGLVKTVLALEHRQLPPTLHFESPNPDLGLDDSPFQVLATLADWPSDGEPRRAGVSSFGIGGTNAHVVLEEAPAAPAAGRSRPWHLLPLSARTPAALARATGALAAHLDGRRERSLADVAHTLAVGRRGFDHRCFLVCQRHEEAVAALAAPDGARLETGVATMRARPVAFLFSGQGAQYVGMGRDLYDEEPAFRAALDRCAELAEPILGIDLRDVLYPAAADEAATARLTGTAIAQPALFAVEWALCRLWTAWGVEPSAMIGHSIGEWVAACLAGVCSLDDAVALVCTRGRLMQAMPPGAMLTVFAAPDAVAPLLGPDLSLAAVNGPALCVVSGPAPAVAGFARTLTARGIDSHPLQTSHAFHSAMMAPVVDAFTERVQAVRLAPPRIPFVSNVTGTWITAEQATDPAYWGRHVRAAVRFADGLATLLQEPDCVLLEVGPGRTLATLARQQPAAADRPVVTSTRHPREPRSDVAVALEALGRLWLAGVAVDWPAVHGTGRRRVPLPTYPFERQRFWIAPGRLPTAAAPAEVAEARADVADWFWVPAWKRTPAGTPAADRAPQRWLVLADDGLGATIVDRLRAGGEDVTAVRTGTAFATGDDGTYTIRPHVRADYDALLAALAGRVPERIVHCLTLTGDAAADAAARREAGLVRGFSSLLHLAQALGAVDAETPVALDVVTDGMQEVAGDEPLWPEKATILGPCLVIPQESANVTCRTIDLDAREAARGWRSRDALLAELLTPAADVEVALRGNRRWVRDFEPASLPEDRTAPRRLRARGTYLVTGGLGGLGLVLAAYLARTVQARLVLTGRSPFPARETWDGWCAAHGDADPVARRIHAIRHIEALGGEVLVVRADVTDPDAMRAARRAAEARFGPIHGVIHAAGIPGGGMLQRRTPEATAAVLAPKVEGTLVLDALFPPGELDLLVLCSSLNATLGGIGQVDYCAANAFQDAFASWRTARGDRFTIAVQWDTWRDVGMAERGGAAEPLAAALGEPVTGRPLLDRRIAVGTEREVFETDLETARHWVLDEHRLMGHGLVPGTAYLEMVREAVDGDGGTVELRDVFFSAPLLVPDGETHTVRTILTRAGEEVEFRVVSRDGADGWQEHATGKASRPEGSVAPERRDLGDVLARCRVTETIEGSAIVERFSALFGEGLEEIPFAFGPRWWKSLRRVSIGTDGILTLLELAPEFDGDLGRFALHPALMDLASAAGRLHTGESYYLPLCYRALRLHRPLTGRVWCWIKPTDTREGDRETVTWNIDLLDDDGTSLVEVEEFTIKRINDPHAFRDVAAPAAEAPSGPIVPVATPAPDTGAATRAGDGIAPADGATAFARLLERGEAPRMVVSTRELRAAIARARTLTLAEVARALEASVAPAARHPRPGLATPYVAPRTDLERQLAEIWQDVLGIDGVGVEDGFFELGGHSLLAIQTISRIRDSLRVQLPIRRFFEGPTVAAMAEMVARSRVDGDDGAIPRLDRGDAEDVLRRIDELSDEEVDAMLRAEDAETTAGE